LRAIGVRETIPLHGEGECPFCREARLNPTSKLPAAR
jgi:hypothetical protein